MSLQFDISANLSNMDKALNEAKSNLDNFAKNGSKSLDQFEKRAKNVGGFMSKTFTAGILAGGTALLGLAQNVGNVSDRLLDLADITGLTTDQIQEYQFVAQQAGVSTETVTRATEGLVRRLKETGDAGSSAEKSLSKLGITTKSADGSLRNAGNIVDETITKLAEMENTTERNALANEVFGRAWTDLAPILSMGADGIDEARQKARDLGIVLDGEALEASNKFRQATQELSSQMIGLKNQIGAKLAPVLTKLIPLIQAKLTPAVEKLGNFIDRALTWFDGLSSQMKSTIGVITAVVAGMGPLLLALGGIASILPAVASGLALLTGPIGLIVAGIAGLTVVIVKNWDTVKKWAENVANFFIRLYNVAIEEIHKLILGFKMIWRGVQFYFGAVRDYFVTWKEFFSGIFGSIRDVLDGVFSLDLNKIKQGLSRSTDVMVDSFNKGIDRIKTRANTFTEDLKKDTERTLNNILSGQKDPVTFEASETSKEKLKEDVAESVSQGVAQGLGRATQQSVSSLQGAESPTQGDTGFNIPTISLQPQIETITEEMAEMMHLLNDFNDSIDDIIRNNIANTFAGIGEALGRSLQEGNSLGKSLSKVLLSSVGGLLVELGKQAIQVGVGLIGIKKALKTLNPAVAIGAGTALIALGSAFASASGSIGGQIGSGGGGGGSAGAGGVEDPSRTASFSSSASGENAFRFIISGNDLVSVVDRNREQNELIGG